jgi:hypothetical protein
MTSPRLPGSAWLRWVRNLPVRVGVLTAAYLTAVMVISVFAANRLPFLEPLAQVRNLASYAGFALIFLLPMTMFLRRPLDLFASGITAWTLFALAYNLMGFFFVNLHVRLREPFNVWMLGAITYGLVAVLAWVVSMALDARHQPAIASRRRPQ